MARASTEQVYENGLKELRALKARKHQEEMEAFHAEVARQKREKYLEELNQFQPEWLTDTKLPTLRLTIPRRDGSTRKLVVAVGGEICGWVFGDLAGLIRASGILENPVY